MWTENLEQELKKQELMRDEEVQRKLGILKKKTDKPFMVMEAPADHPDNTSGTMKILME